MTHTFLSGSVRGEVRVPGDKSISHRALILGAHATDPLRITHLNPGRDVQATLEALVAIGARVQCGGADEVSIIGGNLSNPANAIDCMNSGSTARMLLGVCAGAHITADFIGDDSLSRRPMEPVAAQLRAFGATIRTTDGHLPLDVEGAESVQTRHFILLSPSAQVKSALLFAALFAKVDISIGGDRNARDHTERLLKYLGAQIAWDRKQLAYTAGALHMRDVEIVGDFSSAAFFITAATITPGSDLVLHRVGVNTTRTGLLDALRAMGASIEIQEAREIAGEPAATIRVRYAPLHGIAVASDVAERAIDEIPLIAAAAAFAQGPTKISGIGDLRTKESDRIAAIERLLSGVGVGVDCTPSGIIVHGGTPQATGTLIETHGDHRTAMTAGVLACAAGPISIDHADSIEVSFPSFIATLASVQAA